MGYFSIFMNFSFGRETLLIGVAGEDASCPFAGSCLDL
jgi:hypothetical protein